MRVLAVKIVETFQKIISKILSLISQSDFKAKEHEQLAPWYEIAKLEMGIKEIDGLGNNERILEYHAATRLSAKADEVPWCSAFVCWCLNKAGYESTKSALAQSYIGFGEPIVGGNKKGDICVFSRALGGHVGFYDSEDETNIFVLGGNQSDSVKISPYPKSRLLDIRRPTKKI